MTPVTPRYRSYGAHPARRIVATVAYVMAAIIGLWILLFLVHANRSNGVVRFVHDAATWLAGWAQGIFTFDQEWARVVCDYGLAAVVYLIVGHALAGRLYRR
ncbi:hypothetical protein [Streptomyces sp. CoH27]|uniref:hypothetical protein n=1 Tax=Streptomyces sp. CoH27 TaxID=2875763 RepID=UPI001CD5A4B7|nr:hypothetical protein [Streptomyces sp. CoH27]